jgi:hypothetical protein
MSEQLNRSTETRSATRKAYAAPELIRFGTIRELTGHCSSGCNHDSNHANEFYKPPDPL